MLRKNTPEKYPHQLGNNSEQDAHRAFPFKAPQRVLGQKSDQTVSNKEPTPPFNTPNTFKIRALKHPNKAPGISRLQLPLDLVSLEAVGTLRLGRLAHRRVEALSEASQALRLRLLA